MAADATRGQPPPRPRRTPQTPGADDTHSAATLDSDAGSAYSGGRPPVCAAAAPPDNTAAAITSTNATAHSRRTATAP
jgi:hypothetical protein